MPAGWETVVTQIDGRIRSGDWPVDMQLPTTERLLQEFGVGRTTLMKAMGILCDRGLIRGEPGRARFVSSAWRQQRS